MARFLLRTALKKDPQVDNIEVLLIMDSQPEQSFIDIFEEKYTNFKIRFLSANVMPLIQAMDPLKKRHTISVMQTSTRR